MPPPSIAAETTPRTPGAFRARDIVLAAAPLAVFALVSPAAIALDARHYGWVHSFAELFAIVVSATVAAVGWSTRGLRRTAGATFVGPAFLAVGLLDAAHMFSYAGMPPWVTPSGANKGIYFWLAARAVASFALLSLPLASGRASAFARSGWPFLIALGFVAAVYTVVLGHEGALPIMFVSGKGLTGTKIACEVLIASASFAAFLRLWRPASQGGSDAALARATLLMTLGALPFTLYTSVTDGFNLVGHVYKVAAYSFVYRAIFVEAVRTPYAELEASVEALRESEQRFRQLAASVREIFFMLEVETGRFLYVSPAYQQVTGKPLERAPGALRDALSMLPLEARARVEAVIATVVLGTPSSLELPFTRADGSLRSLRASGYPVRDDAGRVVRVAGLIEDTTDRRVLEAQLRQAQKMESVGLLAGGVAHDFNNLLAVILAGSEMLHDPLPPGEHAEIVDEILGAGQRAAGLTRQLLAFSRHATIEAKVLDFNSVIADAESMLRRLLGEDIEVKTAPGANLGKVDVDPGLWGQVLMNLAVNARDAMPTRGRLVIETRDVDLGEEDVRGRPGLVPGRHVCLRVADTGCGMPEEVLAHVFEPFFTTKGVGRGTGLGLSVVYGIVAQSGGYIEARSELGVGTAFQIYLPTVDSLQATPVVARSERSIGGGETVLVVEDDDGVRNIALRGLRSRGYVVITAASGPEALGVLDAHAGRVDLVVTDVVMPRMNGRELADKVRAKYPDLKILFTSGFTDDVITRHGIEAGEVAFLQKPYTLDTLTAKVLDVLARD